MSMFFEFKGKSERELAGLQEERRFLPPFRRKKFQIKQRWLAKAGHLCRRSFFHKVFPHIQCAGKQDDSALDEVLQIQSEGRQKRLQAEADMVRMENELKQKLLEIRK